ncbi:Pentatricopeptide repeat-containing protein [Nymphaea thermarum]|nr:Pentatricopeptide repeat-containing protein [Nymphaea thermarum]
MNASLIRFKLSRFSLHRVQHQPSHFLHSSAPSFYDQKFSCSSVKIKDGFKRLSRTDPQNFNAYADACGSLFKACASESAISEGRLLHGHVAKMGLCSDTFVSIKLLIMYIKCSSPIDSSRAFSDVPGFHVVAWNCMVASHAESGRFDVARKLIEEMPQTNIITWTAMISGLMKFGRVGDAMEYFERIPEQSVVSCTAMISGYVQNGYYEDALIAFLEMVERGIMPNMFTFVSIISGYVGLRAFEVGRSVLTMIVKLGLEHDPSICNSLITLHVRLREVDVARRIFDRMSTKNVVSWTAMLDSYVEAGELDEARRLFDEMPHKNEISWSAMIARYCQHGDPAEALDLYGQMLSSGFNPNLSTLSSLLSAAASLESLSVGMKLHGYVVKIGIENDVFIGSPLIDMYSKSGKTRDARQVFEIMPYKSTVCWNSMITGYSYNNELEEATKMFDEIPERNIVSWNAIIAGYVQNEHCERALEIFNEMQLAGAIPNMSTFSSTLRACASVASLEKGSNFHGKMVKLGIQYGVFMGTALLDMYAKSGDITSARQVFRRMTERNEISWTAMIQALADNGLAEESIALFEEMQQEKVIPTELTFLGVLFACAHCGLVEKGWHYFKLMQSVYHIKPRGKHYSCMVDLLARDGRLTEAEEFIKAMPFQPEANAWAALLNACSIHGNEEIAERAAMRLWELEKENSAGYILLSNIYAAAGRWNDVSRIRRLMKENGLKKSPGCSWVEVKDQVHAFLVGDEGHPLSIEIYRTLDLLTSEMMLLEEAGFMDLKTIDSDTQANVELHCTS